MFQANLRTLIQSSLLSDYFSEECVDVVVDYNETFSSFPIVFIGSDEDLALLKGWILTQNGMNNIPIHHVSSTDSSNFYHLLQKNKAVIYFTKN